ncbi:MAG: polysaccharide deacetylase family protein [Gammaproteobacteria bacterium]|nr:polysaccharide deacetylase family protein [Gammaproteobacteria bacterium]
MKKRRSLILFIILFVLTIYTFICQLNQLLFTEQTTDTVVLLISDLVGEDEPEVKIWVHAAREEGLHVIVMQDNDFLRPCTNRASFAGVILPDQIHKNANRILIDTLDQYVRDGGQLMLVYDAGLHTPSGHYSSQHSRFSKLAGINYGMYSSLLDKMTVWEPVLGTDSVFSALHVPPGKTVIPKNDISSISEQPLYALSGYQTPEIQYPVYVTRGYYDGKVLLRTENNLVAGYRQYGEGGVLHVNLPLGYLKGQTDGILLHGFLRYFADNILYLPYLASVPDAIGGLVMNWHLDSNAAFQPLDSLKRLGFFEQGPYSIHFTAGPDSRQAGDQLGLDANNNPETKKWLKFFQQRGHSIGSHGGWMHDYFGDNVSDDNRDEFEPLLVQNKQVLENILGTTINEYSAPKGNQPQWVSEWLQKNGFVAYYFTGNTGMGPTRSYRKGRLKHTALWSFPVLTFNQAASFDELEILKVSSHDVAQWLNSVSDFSVNKKVARLVYFHPRGAQKYPQAMRSWLAKTRQLGDKKKFRWYTMSELSHFLDTRKKIQWSVTEEDDKQIFNASYNPGLEHQTWILAKAAYRKPQITTGTGTVIDAGEQWLVRAGKSSTLQFTTERRAR